MFEAISDSEVSRDDKSTAYESEDCDVEVCSTKFEELSTFQEIEQVEREFKTNSRVINTKLTLWWPSAAQKVLHGMYASKEAKKTAIRTLMHLFEYKYSDVQPLKLPTPVLMKLRALYTQKLQTIEMYAVQIKNNWCDILRFSATQCKGILKEKESTMYYLKAKAIDILKKNKGNPHIQKIVKDEFEKSVRNLDYVFSCRLKLAKTNYKINNNVQDLCKLHDINNQINDLIKRSINDYDKHVFEAIEDAFEKECDNIDFELSKQLQRECEEYWMDTLQ